MARAGGTLLGFALQAILARTLGAADLGTYYAIVSLTGVCAVAGAVGYPVVASRFVARYRARSTPAALSVFLRIGLIDTAIVAFLLASAIAVGGSLIAHQPLLGGTLFLAALAIPPLAVARFASAVANAERRFYVAYLPELVFRPSLLLVLVGLTVAYAGVLSVTQVLIYYVAISWAFMVFQIANVGWSGGAASARAHARFATLWRKLAAVLMVIPLITTMLGDINLVLLWPLFELHELGVFGTSMKMAMLFGFFVQIIHQTLLPDLAEAVHRKRVVAALPSTVSANRVAFVFVLLCAAFAAVFGDRLLAVFGEEFVVGRWPMVIMALGLAPRAAAGPVAQLLVVAGREYLTVASGVLSVVYLALANAALVPTLGLIGAALAFASMMAASALSLTYLLWRHEGMRIDIFLRPATPEA